jgi:hypothetical protein
MLPFLGHMFIAHHQPECPAARFTGSACLSCCYGLSIEQLASFEALLKAADIAGGMRSAAPPSVIRILREKARNALLPWHILPAKHPSNLF